MNTFEDRKKGYEVKYLKDQEAQFKIRAKRNKFLGLWAAELIKPENIDEYVKEVRLSDLEKPGDDDIIDKLLKDFEKKSINISRKDKSLKGILCGGQVLSKSLQNEFEKRFRVPIFEGFGLTETTSPLLISAPNSFNISSV